MKIAVLGAGAWGTAISISLARRHAIRLWARDPHQARVMVETRFNERYLPDCPLQDTIAITSDCPQALDGCGLVLMATTTAAMRETLRRLRDLPVAVPAVWLCKGFEGERRALPHEIAAGELDAKRPRGALSGPSFAAEVARGMPTALTLASADGPFAARVARELHDENLRVYSSDDVVGVEVAGAVKNVIAIAAGISDGLALGHNARAALVTRGLAETTRLGLRLGGRLETFMGLAGAGDLMLTCMGDLSRNRRVGLELAREMPLEAILEKLGHVAEGVHTARAVARLARDLGVEMPITSAVCRVIDSELSARDAVRELMQRDPQREHR